MLHIHLQFGQRHILVAVHIDAGKNLVTLLFSDVELVAVQLHADKHLVEFLLANALRVVCVHLFEERAQFAIFLLQGFVNLFIDEFLKLQNLVRNAHKLLRSLVGVFLFELNLEATENAQESSVVDARIFVLPEVVDEVVDCLFVNLQLQVVKDVSKIFTRDEATSIFVDHLEEVAHGVDFAGSFDGLYHLVDEVLFFGPVFDSVAFEFACKFFVIDGA